MTRDQKLNVYKEAIVKCSRFELKGKTMPYTSANGYMFSQLNKADELGIRFSKDLQEKHIQELKSTYFTSYGATLKGYVLMPNTLLNNPVKLAEYLNEGFDYVMSLEPK